jgi:hypothetical protein
MSRRAPVPDLYYQRRDVYTLHLDPPYRHATQVQHFSPGEGERIQDVLGYDAQVQ